MTEKIEINGKKYQVVERKNIDNKNLVFLVKGKHGFLTFDLGNGTYSNASKLF